MGGRGTILRLVDVVLILFVGFVAISDIQEKSRINFPFTRTDVEEQTEEEENQAIISIIVVASNDNIRTEMRERLEGDGRIHNYEVDLFNPEYIVNWRQGEIDESREAGSKTELKNVLQDLLDEYGHSVQAVNVIPAELSPVGGTVAVYDIANQLNLPFPGVDLSGDVSAENTVSEMSEEAVGSGENGSGEVN